MVNFILGTLKVIIPENKIYLSAQILREWIYYPCRRSLQLAKTPITGFKKWNTNSIQIGIPTHSSRMYSIGRSLLIAQHSTKVVNGARQRMWEPLFVYTFNKKLSMKIYFYTIVLTMK